MNRMKKFIVVATVGLGFSAAVMAEGTSQLSDEKSRVSYAIGMMLGNNFLNRQGLTTNEVDVEIVAQGMKAVQTGREPLLTSEQAQETLKAFQQEFHAKQQARQAELGAKNRTAGNAFLAANQTKPGVQTLPDGLQYQILTPGTGAQPKASDTVTVNYRGTLIDGTEFDNSYKRGQPASFPVGGVIRGWTEALQKMSVGAKWKLFIPSELAYGEHGRPGIPPNATLIFEVELLDVKAATPPPVTAPLTSDIIKVQGTNVEVIKSADAAKAAAVTN